MFELTCVSPLFRFLCEGNGPRQWFGIMPFADGVVCPKESVDLGGGATDSGGVRVAIKVESGVRARPQSEDGLKEGNEEGKEGKAKECCDHF